MDTSRWRTVTWLVVAMAILCAVVFAYEAATAGPCGSECAHDHGAARVSYDLGRRTGEAMTSTAFLAVLPLLLISGVAWVIADIRRPRRLLCARCRTQVAPDAKFCPGCGQQLR